LRRIAWSVEALSWSPNLPADHKGLQIVNAMLGLAGDTHVADLIPVASSMALTGTAAQIPEKIAGLAALGVTEVVYQPAGSDIERELQAFASAAGLEG
jgi:5,10-methylenetetrahydromethanopterin reductase